MSENAVTTNKFKTLDIVYIAIFAALIAVCSWISIPMAVPFTLQTFGVFLAVYLLGGKRGTISVLVYILLGAVGLPVFAGFKGGIGALLGSTGGYIIGFLFSALIMWAFEKLFGKKLWVYALSMLLGLIVCYAFGTVWFMVVYARSNDAVSLITVLGWCVFPFIIPDLVKIALALIIGKNKGIRKVINREEA
ncbi:MAG: biotin transporter BioY [Lachnospiraceae bacterium]|nr:biotin transporter BioY [Lachnospiraceae bacterium]